MTGILALAACTTSTPGPPPTASGDTGEPAAAIAETVGTFAFTSSFADLGLPDGGARRFHLHDALPAFGLHLPFAADFDGDGRDAVGILDDRGGLRFGSDNASGVLAERREVAAGRWPLAGDFDGDGADDFGTVDPETGDVEIWSGLPAGAPAFTLSIPAGWTAVGGDFDGDGVEGLAAYDGYAGDVEIHEPLGSSPRRFLAGTGGYPVAGDLDGDGTDAFGVYAFDRTLTWFDDTGEWSVDASTADAQIGDLFTLLDTAIVAAAPSQT